MAKEQSLPESEWSHFVDIDAMEEASVTLSISPDAEQKAALERRLSILSLDDVRADLAIDKGEGGFSVHVHGTLHATVTQNCVITDEPVVAELNEPIEGWFADEDRAVTLTNAKNKLMMKKGHTEMPITDERDDPESMIDGHVDLGELAAQFLSLSVNPYPHAEGALSEHEDGSVHKDEVADERKNPFAALKDWKSRHGTGENS